MQLDHASNRRQHICRMICPLILGDDPDAARHQVSEVPRSKARIIEYRRHSLRCLACGKINQADWPEDMPRGSFDPRAQAIVAYLTGRLTASHRDAAEAMEVLHGLNYSALKVQRLETVNPA